MFMSDFRNSPDDPIQSKVRDAEQSSMWKRRKKHAQKTQKTLHIKDRENHDKQHNTGHIENKKVVWNSFCVIGSPLKSHTKNEITIWSLVLKVNIRPLFNFFPTRFENLHTWDICHWPKRARILAVFCGVNNYSLMCCSGSDALHTLHCQKLKRN